MNRQVTVLHKVTDPIVRELYPGFSDFSGQSQPGERGIQKVRGVFFRHEVPGAHAAGHGWLSAYVFSGTVVVTNASGTTELVSSVSDRPLEPTQSTYERTVVWHELVSTNASYRVSLALVESTGRIAMASREASFGWARSVSFDSASYVRGSLSPQDVNVDGSLWVAGNLTVSMSARGSYNESTEVTVAGTIQQFSTGGGAPKQISDPAVAVTPWLVLVGFAIYFRDLLAFALARLAFPLYTKLKKDRLLDIPARENIFRLIQTSPGIHFLKIHKTLREDKNKVAFGQLAYHLSQMERFELIVSKREGRFRRYFDTGARLGADTARVALLQTAPVPTIARALLENPGATQGALHQRVAREVPLTRQALAYHLKRLTAKELLTVERAGRFHRYRPTEKLERLAAFVSAPAPAPEPPPAAAAA